MTTIADYFEQAQLALAAYASGLQRGWFGLQEPEYVRRLIDAGMSVAQAEEFARTYSVVDQFTDPVSGFSGTVFEKDGINYFAIRGTESLFTNPQDWLLSNPQVGLHGIAVDQGLAMFNWLQRLYGSEGNPVVQYFYNPVSGLIETFTGTASGYLSGSVSPVSVTGHSLGGHLAMMLSRLVPGTVTSAYTYNAPGFDELGTGLTSEGFFSLLRNASVGPITGAVGTAWNSSIMTHWDVQGDVASAIGTTPGIENIVFSENANQGPIDSHSIVRLTDSFAIYDLFARLDPALNTADPAVGVDKVTEILKAASHHRTASLEVALDSLRRLFKEPLAADPTKTDDPSQFYPNLFEVRGLIAPFAGGLTIDSLVSTSAADLALIAEGSTAYAYRYALKELNPFAVVGTNALYTKHNQSGELEIFASPSSTPAGMTQQYLADRAQMLEFLNFGNTNDTIAFPSNQVSDQVVYADLTKRSAPGFPEGNPTELNVFLLGGMPNPRGPNTRVIGFGTDAADTLQGRDNTDRLYGGMSADILIGGRADDYLEGGAGLDLYVYRAETSVLSSNWHDGNDTVLDTDGKGLIRYTFTGSGSSGTTSAVIGGAAFKVTPTQWQSADGKFVYDQQGSDSLLITINGDAGGSIMIRSFDFAKAEEDGYLGIRFIDALSVPGPLVRTFFGDKQDWDSDGEPSNGIQTQTDDFGNVVRADGQEGRPDIGEANREDIFFGSSAAEAERFQTGGGNDAVFADGAESATSSSGGADWVQLGAGRDFAYGGGGNDLLEGGDDGVWMYVDSGGQNVTEAGGDVLQGGAGNDALFAGAQVGIGAAILAGESAPATGQKGELLSGGAGDDWLVGGQGDDLIFGGGGGDIIVGGAGDDTIASDQGYETQTLFWQVSREKIVPPDGRTNYFADYSDNLTLADMSNGAVDVIYGGAGRDWIFAGVGDDFVDGGTGDDALFGMEGADILIGGAGNDELWGDLGHEAAASLWGDYLDGGDGDDILYGDWGDDILIGGRGNDRLYGGSGPGEFAGLGKDIYVFSRGDGKDQIFDDSRGAEASVLAFGEGFDPGALKVRPGSMLLDFGEGDSVQLMGFDPYDPNASAAFDYLSFADGTVLTFQDVLNRGFDIEGTEEDDNGHDAEHPVLLGTAFKDNIRGFGGNDELQGWAGNDILDGGAGDDRLFGMEGDDTILGGDGTDALVGGKGNDTIFGGDGADGLWGEAGDDLLDGGAGADILIGGAGDDSYVFGAGDAAFDFEGATRILFSAGIAPSEVALRLQFVNTLPTYTLELNGATSDADRMFVQLSSEAQLAAFEFADGTVLDHEALLRETWVAVQTIVGTAADEVLGGYAGSDTVRAGAGNDILTGRRGDDNLQGEAGDDTLNGGAGNDWLEGGDGSDVYLIAQGQGNDTISEADVAGEDVLRFTDVASSGVTLARRANGDLVLTVAGGGTVTVTAQYNGSANGIERVEFSSGTALTRADLDALTVAPIAGTAGDDVLIGTSFDDTLLGQGGADTLDGRAGNDVLDGGPGVDTYVLGGQPGYDTIVESGTEASAIRLASGLEFDDVRGTRQGNDLFVSVRAVAGGLIVPGYYAGATNWTVSSDTQANITLADLLAYVESITPPDTPAEVEAAHLDDAELQYALYLQSFGGSGGVIVNVQAPSDAAVIQREPPFSETGTFPNVSLNIADITGGPSANTMDFQGSRVVIADAGAGDDLIDNQGVGFRNTSPSVSIGSFLYGNAGNDRILGTWDADWLMGGAGSDFLAGSDGNDTYFVFADEDGVEVIDEVIPNVNLGGGHDAFAGARDSTDTLKLIDVDFSRATFSVGEYDSNAVNVGGTGALYKTLDISWGSGGVVRVLLPDENNTYLNQFPGHSYGVESIIFADGATLSQNEIFSFVNAQTTGVAGDQATVNGTENDEQLSAPDINLRTTLNGLGGNDVLFGGVQNDVLNGGAGNDTLDAGEGDDVLQGGSGNDTLVGYRGNDLYIFNRGDGRDQIADLAGRLNLAENRDTLRFGADISPADIGVTQDGSALYLVLLGSQDWVALGGAVAQQSDNWGVDRVEFADGTAWSRQDLFARVGVIPASAFDDLIYGGSGNDIVAGGAGDDQLGGLGGNDILRGESEADFLEEWNSLPGDPIEVVSGTNFIDGGDGDDEVYEEGNNFVAGGAGADLIDHNGNNSVVAFNSGHGADTVYVGGTMTLSLGGIAAGDLVLSEDGSDLVLASGADSIRLSSTIGPDPRLWPEVRLQIIGSDIRTYDLDGVFAAFYAAQGGNPAFQMQLESVLPQHQLSVSTNQAWGGDIAYAYARGELDAALSNADIQQVLADAAFGTEPQFVQRAPAAPINGGDNGGVLLGSNSPELINGGAGNDWLNGAGGDDTLDGGAGNDLLTGGLGADTYVYNLGDGVDTIADPGAEGEGNTVEFGTGITSEMITLGLGSMLVRVGNTGGGLHLTSFDPQAPFGARDIDLYRFADGSTLTHNALLARGFDLTGTDGADVITGTATVDRIRGGLGADVLAGGLGSDTYSYATGDGADVVREGTDSLSTDILRFDIGITSESLIVARDADDILITLAGAGNEVRLADWFTTIGGTVERVEFADGTFWSAAELEARASNHPPILVTPIPDQSANEDAAFSYAVPGNTFSDSDAGDALAYAAARSDGTALPSWLTFNSNTLTFNGTPANDDVGSIVIRVTATDNSAESVYDDFTLTVANTNDAPTVANAISDQSATEDQPFSFAVPANTFADVDVGDTFTSSATRADGSALPSWLSFDAQARTFSGTPLNADVGSLDVRVTATDSASASASDVFTLTVANTNDAPTVANPITDQSATETIAFNYTLPANTFADVDAGDVLGYSASKVDGTALPSWLAFDPQTRTFTGTPPDGSVGSLAIRVTATDQASAIAFDDFVLNIANFVILGTPGNDTLIGTSADDEMDGLGGDDILRAGAGNDVLRGGAGNDTLEGEDGDDYLDGGTSAAGINNLNGGSGNDTYRFSRNMGRSDIFDVPSQAATSTADKIVVDADILPSEIQLSRTTPHDMWLTLNGTPAAYMLVQSQFEKSTPGIASIELIEFLADGTVWDFAAMKSILGTPTQGADIIRGFDDLNDTLLGLGGDDQLYGQYGNDTLEGGLGNDALSGGLGDDTYIFRRGDGQDSIAEQDFSLGDGNDTLLFPNILPSEVNVIKDLQFGALILTVNGSTDQVLINGYFVNRPWDLVEQIRFQDGTVWTVDTIDERVAINGTSAANTLQGTEFVDKIKGLGGNDTLYGLGNDDFLDGGAGADVMYGGTGDDTYVVDGTSDQVVESAGEGTDTVRSSVSWTLLSNVENLTLTGSSNINGTGNSVSNTIIGNTGRNTLNGGAGNDWLDGGGNKDTFLGGTGNDTYVVDSTDDVITENASEGTDTVRSSIAWTLGSNLENLVLTGTANINGTGNTVANVLYGNEGNNVLTGNAGNDTLDGKAGTDTLAGGLGNDTYVLGRGHGADLVQENDSTAGNTDIASFLSGISEYQVWFQRTGNDLIASIIGTADKLTVQGWYLGSANHVEQFRTAEGKTLLDSQVQNLVNAMAAFSPPPPGQETLPPNYAAALNPVIAANWQ